MNTYDGSYGLAGLGLVWMLIMMAVGIVMMVQAIMWFFVPFYINTIKHAALATQRNTEAIAQMLARTAAPQRSVQPPQHELPIVEAA